MENGEHPEDKSRMEVDSEQIEDKSSAHGTEEGNSDVRVTVTGVQPSSASRMDRSTSVDMMGEERSNTMNDSNHNTSAALSAPPQGSHPPGMSKNGNGGSQSASNSTTAESGSGIYSIEPTTTPPTSYDEQFRRVFQLTQAATQDGQEGYLVSSKWLERVVARSSESKGQTFDKSASEGDVGPVDNSNIVGEEQLDESSRDLSLQDDQSKPFVPLKPGLTLSQDFEVVPAEAWRLILSWYGLAKGSREIVRYANDTAPEGSMIPNIQYELYPPVFTICKLRNDSAGLTAELMTQAQAPAPRIVASRNERFQKFLAAAKRRVGIDLASKVQAWRIIVNQATDEAPERSTAQSGMLTPATSRSGSPAPGSSSARPKMIIDLNRFNSMVEGSQREMIDHKDETNNDKYNGRATLGLLGLASDLVLVLEEQVGGPGGGEFISDATRKAAKKNGVSLTVKSGTQSTTASGRSSPAPTGPMTRGRTKQGGRAKGTVGLTNLGNTCYMNSGLQCTRAVEELTIFFLDHKYKDELNADNPLGHGGQVAKTYAGLLEAIYGDSNATSFAPRNFKNTLGRTAPLFSGYGQQDSQEFMSFLLDGIHEDLNRVLKKPYTENPDSDDSTVNDPEAIRALGEKYRENHRARNRSIVSDLFEGFYKNTMVCPNCNKVSITFDPFSLLTLQLPIEQSWSRSIIFCPMNSHPMQLEVDIDKNSSIRGLKDFVAKRFPGLSGDRLIATEVYSNKIYRYFHDKDVISECNIQSADIIVLYEVSEAYTNKPSGKKQSRNLYSSYNVSSEEDIPDEDSPLADMMAIPIFHLGPPDNRSMSSKKKATLWPTFIMVDKEDAKDYDIIFRKVLQSVANMTTFKIFEEASRDLPTTPSNDSGELIEEDDGSSNTKASSIEGDKSLVDVSMKEPSEPPADLDAEEAIEDGSKEVPDILLPSTFIPPALRNLFEMKHTSKAKEILPSGWSSIAGDRDYPTLASRMNPQSRRSSIQSESDATTESEDGPDEIPDEPQMSFERPQSSDDESSQKQMRKSKGQRNHDRKKMITYGKKKNRGFQQASTPASEPTSDFDGNPMLIRLGEAIILDWNDQAFEALFGGNAQDDQRGVNTWDTPEHFDDPELAKKKATRAARRKNGVSIEDCFDESAKGEVLTEDNAWYCNRCKELRRATKTLEIWTAPDILVVHLKRFGANRRFNDKIDALVDFPTEGLDLNGRVGLPEDKDLTYDLFAVDNHYGGLGGGHYTAFAKNFFDGKWYEYNDSQVTQRSAERVVTQAAYLLFYRRRSAAPLGPPYLQNLIHNYYDPTPPGQQGSGNGLPPTAPDSSIEGANESTPPSREGSPNDQRLDDNTSSHPGSSGGARQIQGVQGLHQSQVAGGAAGPAAREGLRMASRGGAGSDGVDGTGHRATAGNLVRREIVDDVELPDQFDVPPPSYDQIDDEGYGGEGMVHQGDLDVSGIGHGPYGVSSAWDFSNVPLTSNDAANLRMTNPTAYDDSDDDVASNAPMVSGSDGEMELQDRMMEDFGDELSAPVNVSRALTPESGHMPDLEDVGPVREIRLGEGDELKMD